MEKDITWSRFSNGFTIIELLVVVTIIAVLASIVTVSYGGVSSKATEATLKSDLANASKKLKLYYVEHDIYPQDLDENGCPTIPADSNYCIKPTSGNIFYYTATTPYADCTLSAEKGDIKYKINCTDTAPTKVTTILITAMADISGTVNVGQILTAGVINPAGATVSYQWKRSGTINGSYTDIPGADTNNYLLTLSDSNAFIKVLATGNGGYSGTVESDPVGVIQGGEDWINIGNQTWSKRNMNIGTMRPKTTQQTNNSIIEKYCYLDVESNCTIYGAYYRWNEAMQYSIAEKSKGICPDGSHIPSDGEWKILEMYLGMSQADADSESATRGTNQATQLKVGGSSGMEILLSGYTYGASWYDMNTMTHIWTSTEKISGSAFYRYIHLNYNMIFRGADVETAYGYPVRCIKD